MICNILIKFSILIRPFIHYYYDNFYGFNPKDDDGESQTTKDPESSDSTSATTKPTKAPPIVGKYHCKIDNHYCLQIQV